MIPVRYVAALTLAAALAACGSVQTDQTASSTSTTTSTVAMPQLTPAATSPSGKPVPFRDYLSSIGVSGLPVHFDATPGLEVTVPIPTGWARTSDPLFATGVEFVQPVGLAGNYPSTTLMAIGLIGDFDPGEAVRHANVDALPPMATGVTESFDDYQGFPSAAAQGNAADVQHYSRIVIATVPSTGKRYLVQLTATTRLDQPIAQSPALTDIVAGLKVTVT